MYMYILYGTWASTLDCFTLVFHSIILLKNYYPQTSFDLSSQAEPMLLHEFRLSLSFSNGLLHLGVAPYWLSVSTPSCASC